MHLLCNLLLWELKVYNFVAVIYNFPLVYFWRHLNDENIAFFACVLHAIIKINYIVLVYCLLTFLVNLYISMSFSLCLIILSL